MKHETIIIIGFTLFALYVISKRVGEGSKMIGIENFTMYRGENDVIISVPDMPELGRESQYMMVISGMYHSSPEWMLNEIPMWIKNTRNIGISPYTQDVEIGMESVQDTFAKHTGKWDMGVTSLTGFSSGGARVMDYYQPNNFSKVMILDPAISDAQAGKQYEGEVIFLYGSPLHDNYNAYADEYNRVSTEIINEGGVVEELNLGHYQYPKYGFEKFGNIL